MSKYTGSVTVLDDQGESVFERELTPDQIIDELLGREHIEITQELMMPPIVIPPPAEVAIERTKKPKKGKNGKTECAECQSSGRHRKECSKAKRSEYPKRAETKIEEDQEEEPRIAKREPEDNGRILTEKEYSIVRDLKDNGRKNSMEILAALPNDIKMQQVNWAILIRSYERYHAHASAPRS